MGNVGPRLISFILMPFYTFWMSEADFGIQDILLVYSVLLVPYVTLGLYEAVFVFPKGKDLNAQQAYFTSSVLMCAAMQILLAILLLALPSSFLSLLLPDKLINWLPLLFLLIVIQSYQRVIQSFTRGIDKLKVFGLTGIIYAGTMLPLALWLVPKKGLLGYWIALLSADVCAIIYSFIAIKGWRYFRISHQLKAKLKEMLKFSVPLIPNATMWWVINSINRPLIIDSVGLDGVGLYAVASKFPSIISMVFTIFFSAFQISAIEEYDTDSFKTFYTNIFRGLMGVQIVFTIGFALLGGVLFDLVIDKSFYAGVRFLPILCLGVCLSNIAAYVGVVFTVVKKTKYFLYSTILASIIAVIANYIIISPAGIMGACIAVVLSQISMATYRYLKSKRYVSFEKLFNITLQILLLSLAVICYYIINHVIIRNIIEVVCLCVCGILNYDLLQKIYIPLKHKINSSLHKSN